MKRLFAGKDNKAKRRISAIMAGVITLTTIGGITFFKQEKVEAKETLYSIDKLINDLEKNDEAYSILQVTRFLYPSTRRWVLSATMLAEVSR